MYRFWVTEKKWWMLLQRRRIHNAVNSSSSLVTPELQLGKQPQEVASRSARSSACSQLPKPFEVTEDGRGESHSPWPHPERPSWVPSAMAFTSEPGRVVAICTTVVILQSHQLDLVGNSHLTLQKSAHVRGLQWNPSRMIYRVEADKIVTHTPTPQLEIRNSFWTS